jgi:hypothetical protein
MSREALMNIKPSEKAVPLEDRIRQALKEEPIPPPEKWVEAGVALSDQDFLKQAEEARVEVGGEPFVPFWGRIEVREDVLDQTDVVAGEIAGIALDIAYGVARYNALKGKA